MSSTVRSAGPEDYEHFVRLFPELGVDDPIPKMERWQATLMPGSLLVERDGVVIGYGYAQVLETIGYIRHVISDPSCRRQGVGRIVMDALRERFAAAGCTEWRLNVAHDNTAAISLYEACGMQAVFPTTVVRLPWAQVASLPPPQAPAVVRELSSDEEDAVGVACGVEPGLLPGMRTDDDAVVIAVFRDDKPVGVARFDPAFPGAMPFRLREVDVVRPVLEKLSPIARPEDSETQLVIEDNAELAGVLVDAGATVRLRILHMRGSL